MGVIQHNHPADLREHIFCILRLFEAGRTMVEDVVSDETLFQ